MYVLSKIFNHNTFSNIKVGQASKYSIDSNDILSLIAGQGGADSKVLDQIYKLYNIDNRNTKIENKLNLQNNQISKCQNENNSNIKIEIDEDKVEKVDINDNIDLSYNDNKNNKNRKMHEIGNNDNNCADNKCSSSSNNYYENMIEIVLLSIIMIFFAYLTCATHILHPFRHKRTQLIQKHNIHNTKPKYVLQHRY